MWKITSDCGIVYHKKTCIIIILLINCKCVIPAGSVLQCKTGQYNTVQNNTLQYNTVQYNSTHHTKNTQRSRQPSKRKNTRINLWLRLCFCGPKNLVSRIVLTLKSPN
jgi:hypothetical protein